MCSKNLGKRMVQKYSLNDVFSENILYINWYDIWTVRGMCHDFNITFTKILLDRNSDIRVSIIGLKCSILNQFMMLSRNVV